MSTLAGVRVCFVVLFLYCVAEWHVQLLGRIQLSQGVCCGLLLCGFSFAPWRVTLLWQRALLAALSCRLTGIPFRPCYEATFRPVTLYGSIDYGRSGHRGIRGHRDFQWNTRSRSDKYTCRVQNDHTPMSHLLAGGIGSNDVTCALVPVVRV